MFFEKYFKTRVFLVKFMHFTKLSSAIISRKFSWISHNINDFNSLWFWNGTMLEGCHVLQAANLTEIKILIAMFAL